MKGNHLQAGDSAPQFQTIDALGNAVDLSAYKDKHVLLVFLRYSGCPFCNLTIHRLTLEYKMLAKNGCEVIALVQSGAENIRHNIYDRHPTKPLFPIIPDPERQLYDLYGITTSKLAAVRSIKDIPYWLKSAYGLGFKQTEVDGNLLLVPAMFLIGPGDQRIVKAEYGTSFYDHTTFTSIYEPLIFQ